MKFVKYHGLGNDFIVINAQTESDLPKNQKALAQLAQGMCHRNFGVGADGLLILRPSQRADFAMQIINADGSEPEMCGNGIRCLARYAYETGVVSKKKIQVETLAGIMLPEILEAQEPYRVQVDMGEPRLERSQIPMIGPAGVVVGEPLTVGEQTFAVTAVSMGNPHCVVFVEELSQTPIPIWGPQLETHPAFPEKTNVEWVQVLDAQHLVMRVWERGVGQTMACGTGACAIAVAAHLNGFTQRQVEVQLLGGNLEIFWANNKHVYMTGPAERVFAGEYGLK